MHEFSTAVSIVNAVKSVAEEHSATRVVAIRLQIGEMSMLNHEQLLFGIEIAAKNTVAEGAAVTIERLPTKIVCKNCDLESIIDEQKPLYELLSSLVCPKCESREVDIIQGRECVIKDIQAVVDDE